jgi:integrase
MADIQKRTTKDGTVRWVMKVFVGRDENGKRKFITRTFGRKQDADAAARALEVEKDAGRPLVVPTKTAFGTYLDHWLGVKAGQVRARTIYDYKGLVRRWVTTPPKGAPQLAAVRMSRLTHAHFEELYNWMREQGRSPRTIESVHVVLRMALKDAVRKKVLGANPTDLADVPRRAKDDDDGPREKTVVHAMDRAQASRFLDAARADRFAALWYVLLTGGLRPSEALALGWEHVDFDAGRVRIERSLTRVGVKGWRLVGTKTPMSRRTVPLPPVTMKAMRDWKKAQARDRIKVGAEWQDHGLVFTTHFGEPMDGHNLTTRNFRRIMAAAELGAWEGEGKKRRFRPSFRPYDLRHTCATLLLQAGENAKVVSERLGHSTITLTMDTYSHVLPSMQEQAADRLESMFGG